MDQSLLKLFPSLIGVDEVGRGPIAGPVVACAVKITSGQEKFLEELIKLGVTDSKKLSTKKREIILKALEINTDSLNSGVLYEREFFSFSLYELSHLEIDKINILKASLLCMKMATEALNPADACVLIDGNKSFDVSSLKIQTVVGGDAKSFTIGLASIIAKEFRDKKMSELSKIYKGYGFESNAGYPTKEHLEALLKLGVTPVHRKSYAPVKKLL